MHYIHLESAPTPTHPQHHKRNQAQTLATCHGQSRGGAKRRVTIATCIGGPAEQQHKEVNVPSVPSIIPG